MGHGQLEYRQFGHRRSSAASRCAVHVNTGWWDEPGHIVGDPDPPPVTVHPVVVHRAQQNAVAQVREPAAELGISEPAVSSALAALRLDLGDPLFVRSAGGIALTPGGRKLADLAQEIVALADHARWEVAHADTARPELRVLATASFAEHAAGRLFDVFTRWVPASSVDVVVEAASDVAALLKDRAYDIALGARPSQADESTMEVIPFLRYQRILIASKSHPLAGATKPLTLQQLLAHQWFTGPAGIEEFTEIKYMLMAGIDR